MSPVRGRWLEPYTYNQDATHPFASRIAPNGQRLAMVQRVFFLLLSIPLNLGDGGLQLVLVLELLEHGRVHALPQRLGQERDHLHTAHPIHTTAGTQERETSGRIREGSGYAF